jgi:hypothetical protein
MFLQSRVTLFLSLKGTHNLVVKKTFDETALPHDEDYTHTNCNSKVQLWSCQGACELKALPQPAEEDIQSLSLSVNSVTETDVQQMRYQSVPGSCRTSFLSSCKRLSAPSSSLCCKTSAILVTFLDYLQPRFPPCCFVLQLRVTVGSSSLRYFSHWSTTCLYIKSATVNIS